VLYRLVLPFGLAWALFGLRPRDLGLHAPGNPYEPAVRRIWPVYLALFLGVLPFVLHAATAAPFLAKYPLGRAMVQDNVILLHHFIVHECFYLLVFVSGEAFWRGLLSFGLERDFGLYALALMIVPYVTGHFGKPLPETLGAIVAGGVLGWLALKHRSVWLGVAVHYGVAITMDLLAIQGNGFTIESP
jgi:membrane protease YdiL (CAAX protease family)